MKYNKDEKAVRCGYCNELMNIQNTPFQLPVGTILAGRYYIGRVLGQGGFGITYVGCDLKLNMKVAIKEYYPQGIVGRLSTYNLGLTVNTEVQKTVFVAQKNRFMKEARILAEFSSDIHVVRVSDIFEENNTAYFVMEYVDGITLDNYFKKQGRMTFDAIWNMLSPLVETLTKIHDKGLIHRDISPANVMLNSSVGVKLIDFGAARDFSAGDEKSMSVVLKPGYAPPEQYSSRGQGPWTDVYALCATIYRVITGVIPVNAFERMANDDLKYPSEMGAVIKPEQEAVLMCGLAVRKKDRFQNVKELEQAIELSKRNMVVDFAKAFFRLEISPNVDNAQSEDDSGHNPILSSNENTNSCNIQINDSDDNISKNILNKKEIEYQDSINALKSADSISAYRFVYYKFKALGNYKATERYMTVCQTEINRLIENKKKDKEIKEIIKRQQTQNEIIKKKEIEYQSIVEAFQSSQSISSYRLILQRLKGLGDYKDTKQYMNDCLLVINRLMEYKRIDDEKQAILKKQKEQEDSLAKKEIEYQNVIEALKSAQSISSYRLILQRLKGIGDYKDTKQYMNVCQFEINRLIEYNHRKGENQQEQDDIVRKKALEYQDAIVSFELANSISKYRLVLYRFKALGNYKSSKQYISKCQNEINNLLNK